MKIDALILAAGQSRRFGSANKLVAFVNGRPLIRHAVDAMLASRADETLVVVAPGDDAVRQALSGCRVTFVNADDYQSGLGHSLAAGVKALKPETAGVLIALGDMPGITTSLVNELCAAFFVHEGKRIVAPADGDERRGHPVLWPRSLFPSLTQLSGDQGARHLIDANLDRMVTVPAGPNGGSFRDIDTPSDLADWLSWR